MNEKKIKRTGGGNTGKVEMVWSVKCFREFHEREICIRQQSMEGLNYNTSPKSSFYVHDA